MEGVTRAWAPQAQAQKSSSVSEAAEQKHIVLVIYIRFPCYESYSMDQLQYMNYS